MKPLNSVILIVVFKLELTYSNLNPFAILYLVLESLVEKGKNSKIFLECFVELWLVCPCSASSHTQSRGSISQTDEKYLSKLYTQYWNAILK